MPVVNVREEGETVASSVSPEETSMTTFEDGWASNTTVNVSVVPVSETEVPSPDSATVKPACGSLSTVSAVTVWLATPS